MTRDQVDRIASGARDRNIAKPPASEGNEAGTGALKTTNVALPQPLPVYIAYFTAGRRADGTLAIERDVYGRDMLLGDPSNPQRQCSN
jgi:murein L,D-transpeptidase YcbB/YkuD